MHVKISRAVCGVAMTVCEGIATPFDCVDYSNGSYHHCNEGANLSIPVRQFN